MSFQERLLTNSVIDFILYFGIGDSTPKDEQRFIKMLNVSIVIFILYSSGCVLVGFLSGDYFLVWFQLPCFLVLAIAIFLIWKGFYTTSITLILCLLILAFSIQQFYYGGDANLHYWLVVPIMGCCLVYPPSHSKLAIVIGSLGIFALAGVELLNVPEKVVSPLLESPSGRANTE
jgi:hypothetical protein